MSLYMVRGRRPGRDSSPTFIGMQQASSHDEAVRLIRKAYPGVRDLSVEAKDARELGPQGQSDLPALGSQRRGLRSHPRGWRSS